MHWPSHSSNMKSFKMLYNKTEAQPSCNWDNWILNKCLLKRYAWGVMEAFKRMSLTQDFSNWVAKRCTPLSMTQNHGTNTGGWWLKKHSKFNSKIASNSPSCDTTEQKHLNFLGTNKNNFVIMAPSTAAIRKSMEDNTYLKNWNSAVYSNK